MSMDAGAAPLILTKLCVPSLRPRTVPRTRLIKQLSPETGIQLILVVAPAGYGKSTLLAEWSQSLQQSGMAVAWYALDTGDDTPILFGSYLAASLEQAVGPIPELGYIAQLLRSSPEIDLERILPTVINAVAASGRDLVLILDDYHLIGSPAIHSAMAFLLEHLPENMHVAIGSRSDPPLPLARLRARGQLLEMGAGSLRFTEDETAKFLKEVMRLELSPEGIASLEERTEGWIAGLQLAALSLTGHSDKEGLIASFRGSHRYLVEYLMEEVVSRQPEEVQSFLLATSILERMCAPVCDAILEQASGSETILKQLERANLFVVSLDDQGYWYRYHHLLRDLLQTRLNKIRPGGVAALHRAACEWLAANGLLREAVGHALQTHDWEYAASLVEQHSFNMIVHSEISTIYEWCSAFPEELMRMHPMLCLLQGLALAYRFRRQNGARVEVRLRQADQLIGGIEDKQAARALTDMAGVVRTFLAMAPNPTPRPQEQLDLSQSMLAGYPKDDPGQFSGLLTSSYAYMALHDAPAATQVLEKARQLALRERLYFGIVESTFHLACITHAQGQLQRAVDICHQGQTDLASMLSQPEQELPALGCLDIAVGRVHLEQDRLEEAEHHLRHGLDLMGWGMNPFYLMTAYAALIRLCGIQGHPQGAVKYLDDMEAAWPDISFCTHGLRFMQALRSEPADPAVLAEVATWCQGFSPPLGNEILPPGLGPHGAADAYYLAYLAWARAQIALGHARTALPYLERQLDLASTHGLTNRVIELSIVEAQARRAEGDEKRAWSALNRALSAAEPQGYVRIFDQGPALSQLLAEAAQRDIHRDYIERVLAVIQTESHTSLSGTRDAATNPYGLGPAEQLTERELEIVRLMAGGATNQEIAERLVITVGTVKSHINHILRKLDAHNRTEAVARVRGLGLLEI